MIDIAAASWLACLAMIMEFIDSALGMMYGTVLSPLLILMGHQAKDVVPAILISQAVGGFIASWRHQRLENANFNKGTIDHQITVTLIWCGVFACFVAVFLAISLPPRLLNTYIGVLVTIIALMILSGKALIMTANKIYLLGGISAFNKALSGGGFGPLVAGGQLVFKERCEKGAIGSTDFAEAPICLLSFLLWLLANEAPPLALMMPLCAGAAIGGFLGPKALSKLKAKQRLKQFLGVLILIEGILILYKAWLA